MKRIGKDFKIRPVRRITCDVNGRPLIVFFPGSEYEGTIMKAGRILVWSVKYQRYFDIPQKDVKILNYVEPPAPKNFY